MKENGAPPLLCGLSLPDRGSFRDSDMSSLQVYSLQQEKDLFHHSLLALQPYHLRHLGQAYQLKTDAMIAPDTWADWEGLVKASSGRQDHRIDLLHGTSSALCGKAEFHVDGPDTARHLVLTWYKVEELHRDSPPGGIRPAALFLQLVLQLARLSKIHAVLMTDTVYDAQRFYRSFGVFALARVDYGKTTTMFINPQNAFNTVAGLLHTRSRARREEDDRLITKLPVSMQLMYQLQRQDWLSKDGALHCSHFEILLQVCNYPGKPQPQTNASKSDAVAPQSEHHGPLIEYGRISVHLKGGVVETDKLEVHSHTTDAAHHQAIEAVLRQVGHNAGEDMRTGVWRGSM
jgi:hypothetical protein